MLVVVVGFAKVHLPSADLYLMSCPTHLFGHHSLFDTTVPFYNHDPAVLVYREMPKVGKLSSVSSLLSCLQIAKIVAIEMHGSFRKRDESEESPGYHDSHWTKDCAF